MHWRKSSDRLIYADTSRGKYQIAKTCVQGQTRFEITFPGSNIFDCWVDDPAEARKRCLMHFEALENAQK